MLGEIRTAKIMSKEKFESTGSSEPERGTPAELEPHKVALLEFVVRIKVALNKLPHADTLTWRYNISSNQKNFNDAAEAANLLLLRADLSSISDLVSVVQSLEESDGAMDAVHRDLETAIKRSSASMTEDAKETIHALWLIGDAIDQFKDRTAQT
jgi:hypothetical protein